MTALFDHAPAYAPAEKTAFFEPAKKILLIEDNPADARLVEILLMDTDLVRCKITHAITLTQALQILETGERFDVILCDLTLPDSRGFETLERLLARFPDQNVIVQTGLSDKTLGLQAVRAGAQDFLIKGSYDGDALGKTLRYAIERRAVLERLEETQRLAHIGHWELDLQSGNVTVSDEVFRIFEIKAERRSFPVQDVQNPEHIFHFFNDLHTETMENGRAARDLDIFSATGQRRAISVKCRYERDNAILHGILQDITERKQSDELRRQHELTQHAAAMKEQFIASVSHEMRTPMNAILGMSNLVLQSTLTDEQRNYIGNIKQSSEILLGIVNDILEVSTMKNGSIQFEHKPFDLHELLANLVKVMHYKINEKSLEFILDTHPNVPQFLVGDKLRLNQILFNLVGNAIKFTDRGFVKLTVEATPGPGGRSTLKFSVQDTGIGIPADHLEAIFENFTRVRHKDRLYEGTGLGLSIARSLVQQQKGEIGVQSEQGVGSCFWFTLPFEATTEAALTQTGTPETRRPSLDRDATFDLLLVEDHKMNQLVARKTLEKQFPNIRITLAENGLEAVQALERQAFDIVLMDMQMPIMDGQEATRHIREKMPPHIATLPVLAMTAHAHIAKEEQFKEYGMDDYVLKPFEPEQLFEKIATYVRR